MNQLKPYKIDKINSISKVKSVLTYCALYHEENLSLLSFKLVQKVSSSSINFISYGATTLLRNITSVASHI